MKLATLKVIKYKGCPIYIRRLGSHFEFIVIFKNKIYNEYIALIPNWWKAFNDNPFTEKEVKDTAMILIGMAKHLINDLKK